MSVLSNEAAIDLSKQPGTARSKSLQDLVKPVLHRNILSELSRGHFELVRIWRIDDVGQFRGLVVNEQRELDKLYPLK